MIVTMILLPSLPFRRSMPVMARLLLWMVIFAYPKLAVLQEMCARIGIVTGKGLTGVIKTHYPKWVLYLLIILSCPAFLLNIGADIAALGEAGNLLLPALPASYCSIRTPYLPLKLNDQFANLKTVRLPY